MKGMKEKSPPQSVMASGGLQQSSQLSNKRHSKLINYETEAESKQPSNNLAVGQSSSPQNIYNKNLIPNGQMSSEYMHNK